MPSSRTPVQLLCIQTTIDSEAAANQLANALVEAKVASCVQVDGPIRSHYRWEGKVEASIEYRLTIKTPAEKWLAVEEQIRKLHSYSTPEIMALEVTHVSESYLAWAIDSIR